MATGASNNESVVAKYPADLRDGDHLFVRRFTFFQKGEVNEKGAVKYTYSHHGIYDAVNDRVIAFGEPSTARPLSKESGTRMVALPGTQRIAIRIRKIALDSMTALSRFYSSSIVYQEPSKFLSGSSFRYLEYRYTGKPAAGDDTSVALAKDISIVEGISPDHARNASASSKVSRSHAGDVARWLVENQPTIFGRYSFRKCNCEHFATLCKTFTGGVDELAAICRDEATDGAVPMSVWRLHSKTRSLQVERYIRGDTRFRGKVGDENALIFPGAPEYEQLDEAACDIMEHESDDDGDMHDGPGNDVDTGPGNDVDTKPSNDVDTKPGNDVDTKPGNDVDTKPGNDVDTKPGNVVNDGPSGKVTNGTHG